jgi:hypothetical protein
MTLATRDELLKKVRARTRQEIEGHESKESAWTTNKPTARDEMADYAAELFDYIDPTDLKPVARFYC